MANDKSEIMQGTLDLMVLKTLDAMGPLHGYGIARRIEQRVLAQVALARGDVALARQLLEASRHILAESGAADELARTEEALQALGTRTA